jgi:hypothetical protein
LSIFDGKALKAATSALFWPILLRTFDITWTLTIDDASIAEPTAR